MAGKMHSLFTEGENASYGGVWVVVTRGAKSVRQQLFVE